LAVGPHAGVITATKKYTHTVAIMKVASANNMNSSPVSFALHESFAFA